MNMYNSNYQVISGHRKHRDDSPGAIQIPFKGNKGWKHNDKGEWFNLRKYI